MSAERKKVDWEAVELDYRAGMKSLAVIGKEHGVTKGRISQVAKKEGWARDLTGRVRAKREALLNAKAVNAELNGQKAEAEHLVVAAVAQTQADLILDHRRDIRRARKLAEKLMLQLVYAADNRETLEAGIEATEANPFKRESMLKAVSLPQHASTLKTLADALKTCVSLEREAFNVGGDRDDGPAGPGEAERSSQAIQEFAAKLRAKLGT